MNKIKKILNDSNKPVSIYFDACAAISKNTGP
jgi:hypothetical protein